MHTLQIIHAPLQVGQALLEDLLPLRRVKKLEERDARKKLGLIASLLRRKIAQRGVQQRDATLGQVVEMAIGFAFLLHYLPHDRSHLFKALERWIQDRIIEGDCPAKHLLDAFFDLVAVLWPLAQHGQYHDLCVHMLYHSMLF